ncbi:TPA: transposase [Candidatus Falkowbacteria bacterium]|nr:transposase [Candidatus Falkowbacteria bacterium]
MFNEYKSRRLDGWNYGRYGYYFVTIKVRRGSFDLGRIIEGEMKLNQYGEWVKKCWVELERHFEIVEIDEFNVLPDHVHGILFIKNLDDVIGTGNVNVGARHTLHLHLPVVINNHNYEKLPVIIGSFKSAASKLIHQSGWLNFKWQRSYHDHIIRDEKSLERIRHYIRYNAVKHGSVGCERRS